MLCTNQTPNQTPASRGRRRRPRATPYPAGLTRRQVDVLRLVAAGLTNKQVAKQLGLSVYTVETHLRHIFGKLAVATRGAAIRFAIEHDLA